MVLINSPISTLFYYMTLWKVRTYFWRPLSWPRQKQRHQWYGEPVGPGRGGWRRVGERGGDGGGVFPCGYVRGESWPGPWCAEGDPYRAFSAGGSDWLPGCACGCPPYPLGDICPPACGWPEGCPPYPLGDI